jgi:hypothetical protein
MSAIQFLSKTLYQTSFDKGLIQGYLKVVSNLNEVQAKAKLDNLKVLSCQT